MRAVAQMRENRARQAAEAAEAAAGQPPAPVQRPALQQQPLTQQQSMPLRDDTQQLRLKCPNYLGFRVGNLNKLDKLTKFTRELSDSSRLYI